MRHVRLVAICDEYDSKPGLVLKGTRSFEGLMADRDGLTLAHDLLEHQNGAKAQGEVWDELEALGGIWYIRGRWGDMMTPSYHSPAVNVASDVTRMFIEWDGTDCPGGRKIGRRRSLWDEDFAEIIAIARHDIPREVDREDLDRAKLELYLDLAMRRLRSGFRKAQRRFEGRGQDRFHGNNLFRAVKDAVADVARYIDFEGQEFVLSYGNGEATCREAWEVDA